MEELSIWQEIMMEKYPEKTMTLNNFFEELSYNDLPIFMIRNLYGVSVFPIAKTAIVLENGECVGMGTHKELLQNCQVYQEIAYSQLSKEELENG